MQQFVCFVVQQLMKESNAVLTLLSYDVCYCGPVSYLCDFKIFFYFRVMKQLQLKQVGRYYYDPKRPASIPQHKIELWPGYITSIQCYEGMQ